MKRLLLILGLLLAISSFSKDLTIKLKSGDFIIKSNKYSISTDGEIQYRFIVFEQLPTLEQKSFLRSLGVDFLEYVAKNTYIISFSKSLSLDILESNNVVSVVPILPKSKIDPKIQSGRCPEWALNNNIASLKLLVYKNSDLNRSFEILAEKYAVNINNKSKSIFVQVPISQIIDLAKFDFISFIEPIEPPSYPENKTARTLHRSNVINTKYFSGRKYDGSGIKVMMQDDGLVGPHIDRQGRVDQSFCIGCSSSSNNNHGDHVSGTIMGAGNLNPLGRGMADASFLYVYGSSNNNYYDVPMLYNSYDVTITSKSYSNGCNAGYTSLARDLDEQVYGLNSLIHVFSAGNDGASDCGYGAGSGWGNVTGGHKQAKNVITVANLDRYGGLANSSSRGPAADGRIKPDVGGKGTSVFSPISQYDYATYTGTSMSCPGVSGVMAQLYQAYKELNGGVNPNSALMKCILLNSADDIGNSGPDFKHGWGEINAFKAVKMIEDVTYFSSSTSQSLTSTHTINIPAGTRQVKIMTYWHDKEASANASVALVNDLNTTITDPSGTTYNPWVLDFTPNSSNLNQLATRGIDDRNNMEQITINDPIPGTYTLSVNGFSVPFGPQDYYVTYEFTTDSLTVTYPIGGESVVPGEFEYIRWDTYGNSGLFTLQYSIDNGNNWSTISTSASGSNRYYAWNQTLPPTDQALIRVGRAGIYDQSDAPFTVVAVPENVNVDWICPDSILVSWDAVSGATSYEVSMLGTEYMDSMTTTTNTSAIIINPNPAITDSWFSVCAKVNNGKGRRAIAVNAQPVNSSCIAPPIASFTTNDTLSCSGEISFTDISFNQPNNWLWDFGDGNNSTLQNPTHTYLNEGIYTVTLFVSNGLGQDSITNVSLVTVDFPDPPNTFNDTSCSPFSSLALSASSNTTQWYTDTLGSASIYTGTTFNTPPLSATTTYYVREVGGQSIYGGPTDNTIGNGGFYYGNRHMIFDSYKACKLVSATVYADIPNTVTFELRDNNGTVLDDTTLSVVSGQQTLYFDFNIPVGNDLQLGVNGVNSGLYRNTSGSNFPLLIGSALSFSGANITSTQDNWYYYYNIEIQENCISEYAPVTAHVIPGQLLFGNQSVEICAGNAYSIGGNTYTSPGVYIDTVSNTGSCDSVITTTLTVFPQNVIQNPVTICNGDSYIVGNSSYSLPGVYTNVLVDLNGCDSVVVTTLNVIDLQTTINQIGFDLQALNTNGIMPYTYLWSTGETSMIITPQVNGQYWVVSSDANGCQSDTAYFTVTDIPSSIFDYDSDNINIYPNPTNDIVNIDFKQLDIKNVVIKIINISGDVVLKENISIVNGYYFKKISLNTYAKGAYFIEINTDEEVIKEKVILK